MVDAVSVAQVDGEIAQGLAESAAAVAARLALGVVFLVVAAVGVRLVLRAVRAAVARRGHPEYAGLAATLVAIALWFGVALAFLSIVGLEDIAASLGTATGFLALGVSYALSGMLADTVAGVYLLRDPDFEVGDRVTVEETTATVEAVDLRKSRLRLDDGDLLVVANQDVEKRWTKVIGSDEGEEESGEETVGEQESDEETGEEGAGDEETAGDGEGDAGGAGEDDGGTDGDRTVRDDEGRGGSGDERRPDRDDPTDGGQPRSG